MQVITEQMESFVPDDCDLYVLGLQEGVSDSVYQAVAAYTGCFRLPLMAKLHRAKETAGSGVRSRRMGHAVNVQSFIEDFEGGADLLPVSAADQLDRVWGRGDGAFLRQKFTGIAVFVHPVVAPYVRLLGVYKHAFGASEGSKGGAAVALGVYDQTLAFVNTHMASKKTELRRTQFAELVTRMGAKLGGRGMELLEEFHHVVWMGDLNYHVVDLPIDDVLSALQGGRTAELLAHHDELTAEKEEGKIFWGFVEPVMSPDFLPTYKKIPGRGPIDYSDPSWPDKVYNSKYKEPLYKGGRVVDRIPSWTDRIQYHSLPSRMGTLAPELLDPSAPDTSPHNYHAVNDGMDISDHSPVFATFQLDVTIQDIDQSLLDSAAAEMGEHGDKDWAHKARAFGISGLLAGVTPDVHPSLRPLVVLLRFSDVQVDFRGQMRTPRAVSVMFPLPFEDGDELPERAKVVRADKTFSMEARSETSDRLTGTIKSIVSRAGRLPRLHLLLKVSLDDNTKAQAVVCLGDTSFTGLGTAKHTFFAPLSSAGLPLVGKHGKPVNATFTLEMNGHYYTNSDSTQPVGTATMADGSSVGGAPSSPSRQPVDTPGHEAGTAAAAAGAGDGSSTPLRQRMRPMSHSISGTSGASRLKALSDLSFSTRRMTVGAAASEEEIDVDA